MFMLKKIHDKYKLYAETALQICADEIELRDRQISKQAKYIEQLKKRHPNGQFKKLDVDAFNGH